MLKPRRHNQSLLGCRRSTASLELALILPLMLLMLGGVYDITEALVLYTQVYNAAHVIVASASSLAVQTSGATILSYDEVQFAESEIWADIPSMRNGYKTSATTAVTISSVTFSPNASCTSFHPTIGGSSYLSIYEFQAPCTFSGYIVWSVAYAPPATDITRSTFVQDVRPCVGNAPDNYGVHQVAGGTNIPDSPSPGTTLTYFLDTLPTATASTVSAYSLYGNSYTLEAGPTPILVADVEFTYQPSFKVGYKYAGVISQNINLSATGLWPVRSVAYYVTTGSIEPLAQEFTEIYGTTSSGITLYSALNDVSGGASNNSTGGGQNPGSAWCVNPYEVTPSPIATPPTNGEL